MNYLVRIAVVFVLISRINCTVLTHLTSVTSSPFVGQLYLDIGNDQPPPEPEMNEDPAIRKEICSQITNSLYFRRQKKEAIDMSSEKMYKKLKHKSKYRTLFEEIYERTGKGHYFMKRPRHHRYVNPYRLKSMKVDGNVNDEYLPIIPKLEFVFLCLVREPTQRAKIAYQVSKEYNVFTGQTSQYIAGRFVFKPPPASIELVILAEEPAHVDHDPNFNVETYYLSLRRERMSEIYARDDPICKLIPRKLALNQNHRICQSVLGSEKLKDEVQYISRPQRLDDCREREVFFQTPEGEQEAARTGRYHEWMVYCLAKRISDNGEVNFCVSRAYKSGQMFVYRLHPPNYEAYLENRSWNVSIVDDGGKMINGGAINDRVDPELKNETPSTDE